jgi:hypothetical protein
LLDNSGSEIPIYMDRYYYKEICLIELWPIKTLKWLKDYKGKN